MIDTTHCSEIAGAATGRAATPRTNSGAGAARLRRSLRPSLPTVSVVVPTLNEARNIAYALWRLPECVTEIIVVDGRSSDDTVETAVNLRPDVLVVEEHAKGKGVAMKRGFAEATGDIIVMLDADGSADAAEIQRFVDALVGGADFAKGSRFMPTGGSIDITRTRRWGNRVLTAMVNLVCQTRYTDLCYGYNAFWRDCLDFIEIDVSGFEIETRLDMLVAASGLAVAEVPSWELERVHGDSNLSTFRDGLRIFRTILTTAWEIRRGRRSVRGDVDGDERSVEAGPNRSSMVVVPGPSNERVRADVRYVAEQLADDGRVLVAFSSKPTRHVVLPGPSGRSTLLGNAPSGYPIWTGRLSAALGARRRQDRMILYLFDGANLVIALIASLVGRLRGERLIVHDPRTEADAAAAPGRLRRVILRLAHGVHHAPADQTQGPLLVVALADGDPDFVDLVVHTVNGLADEAAKDWRFVIQIDDDDAASELDEFRRADAVECVWGPLDPELLDSADVVVVPPARHRFAECANAKAAAGVIVGHPEAHHMMRRLDGVWLARSEVSSLLVTLETAANTAGGDVVVARTVRANGDGLVDAVRGCEGAA